MKCELYGQYKYHGAAWNAGSGCLKKNRCTGLLWWVGTFTGLAVPPAEAVSALSSRPKTADKTTRSFFMWLSPFESVKVGGAPSECSPRQGKHARRIGGWS